MVFLSPTVSLLLENNRETQPGARDSGELKILPFWNMGCGRTPAISWAHHLQVGRKKQRLVLFGNTCVEFLCRAGCSGRHLACLATEQDIEAIQILFWPLAFWPRRPANPKLAVHPIPRFEPNYSFDPDPGIVFPIPNTKSSRCRRHPTFPNEKAFRGSARSRLALVQRFDSYSYLQV